MKNFLTQNGDLFGAEFFSSTRRLPAAARSRTEVHRGRAVEQEQRSNRKKEPPKTLELSFGKHAVVDAEDYDQLNMYKWCSVRRGQIWYARTFRTDGTHLSMHRLITNAPKHLVVDHKDYNGLNNRKSNLRLCTPAQNQYNARPSPGGTSRHKGVYWEKKSKKYRALIGHKSKRYHLGCFDNEDDAGRAYDRKAIELFGEFAYLNFPDEDYGRGGGGL